MDKKIGFIGAGQMAAALAKSVIQKNIVSAQNVFGYDINPQSVQRFVSESGATALPSIIELYAVCEVIFLSVKPQQMGDVFRELTPLRAKNKASGGKSILWITIIAGIPISHYLKELGTSARLIRVMPNVACLAGESASGFCVSEGATKEDAFAAEELLSAVGIALQFPERQLDAVTGLSGSGPAFVYMVIEAMADGGVKMGLSRETAQKLAAQTVLGAAKVVLQTGEHPAVLKDKVCSPRGTTISGVHSLERSGLRAALIDAVEAATLRSRELG
ncbi:MAG: pyrroline-5-carboxylate reductase, partial [Planctomycetaceae bacterium]|nr:pyrroline-5-carboxylate reductase [Planctomycetaceae bacterium]